MKVLLTFYLCDSGASDLTSEFPYSHIQNMNNCVGSNLANEKVLFF